jgi:branched-chain amino acid transport system substrate-binding protein
MSTSIKSIFLALLVLLVSTDTFGVEPVKIGATVSESGHFATEIGPFRRLFMTWAEDVNSRGGILLGKETRPVEAFIYDDRSDEATARRMYERLAVVNKVDLMFGPYSSPLTFAASTAAEAHKRPFMAICANSPKVYNRGYKWIACVIDAAPKYTYRYWEMLKSEGKARTVVFIVEDTLHPKGVHKGAKVLAEDAGLRILGNRIAPPDSRDFSSILGELRRQDPDIIFVSSNIPFAIQFMSQAREVGIAPREFHVIHHSGVFRKGLGPGAELITGQSYWTPGMRLGQHERFEGILSQSRVPLEDYPWAPAYMMAFEVVEAALAKAGTTNPKTLMETILKSKTETIGGMVSFQPNGVGSINTYPSQIIKGRYEVIWPHEKSTSRHIYPATGRKDK